MKLPAIALAGAAVAWNNVVLPRLKLGPRGRAFAGASVGVAAVAATAAGGYSADELGLSRRYWRPGLAYGALAAAVPTLGYSAVYAIAPLRRRFAPQREHPTPYEWMLLHIPVGTVIAEELLFRSALTALTARGWSPWQRAALQLGAFGLWHVYPARAAGDSVPATVAVTGASALIFNALRTRSGSVLAPMLLHFAINVGGAAAIVAAELGDGRRPAP